MSSIIIHHHDLDGFAAGAIARIYHPEAICLSLNYDDPSAIPGALSLQSYEEVVVVDYTLPPETMKALHQAGILTWIDHHASAIIKSQTNGYDNARGLRCRAGELICGAELTWMYYVKTPVPRFLALVGDYDTFRNAKAPEFNQDVLPFFYASQVKFQERFNPSNFGKDDYLPKTLEFFQDNYLCDKFIEEGRLIKAYNDAYFAQLLHESAFVRNIWGLRVLCFNCAGHGSANMVQAFDPSKHDAMLMFSYNGNGWSYGLYTDQEAKPAVDVSKIAQAYGGGGHRAAAGFRTETLLPELLTH